MILTSLIVISNIFGEIISGLHHIEVFCSSLPIFIAVIALFLASTINNYMLNEQRIELANYILAGIDKKRVIVLYTVQLLLLSAFAFLLGCILGTFCCLILVKPYFESCNLLCGKIQLIYSVGKAAIYYIFLQICILLVNCMKLKDLSIKELLKENVAKDEYVKNNFSLINFLVLLMSITILTLNVLLKNIYFISSTFFISLVLFFITSYAAVLQILRKYRKAQHWIVFVNDNIVIFDSILLRQRSFKWYSVIISFCVILSFATYIAGCLFLTSKRTILGHELDRIMGSVQIILAILFLVVIFALMSVKQLTVLKDCKKKYSLLRKLGKSTYERKRMILLEIIINYTFPILGGILILLLFTPILNSYLKVFLGRSTVLFSIQALALFILLYISFTALSYLSYNRKCN